MKGKVSSLAVIFVTAAGLAMATGSPAQADSGAGIVEVAVGDGGIKLEVDWGAIAGTAAATCVPRSTSTTIHEPSAQVYYGALDTIYLWNNLGEAEIFGCSNNHVTIKVQMFDQALDGTSFPVTGPEATGSGKAKAAAVADLTQRYSNVAMATGSSYHQLTTKAIATQTDGKTTTTWCSTRTWTYLATLVGPRFIGSTPAAKC